MARISKYQFDQDVTKDDFVIGSDGKTRKTRNYKLDDLTNFFAKQDAILGNQFAYVYGQGENKLALTEGKMSFNNSNISSTPFIGITEVYLNRYNASGNDVYAYLQAMHNYDGLLELYNAQNTTSFGVFKPQSINLLQNDVIKLTVDAVSANGTITGNEIINTSVTYPFGDKHYEHSQLSASSTWNITHNLNKKPSVMVVDDGENVIVGDINYINQNEITITFTGSVSGKAYLN